MSASWLDIIDKQLDIPEIYWSQKKLSTQNRTGITGVYYQKTYRGWAVTWGNHTIKCTRDFFEACCLRKSLEARNERI